MKKFRQGVQSNFVAAILSLASLAPADAPRSSPGAEVRALWVDGFHAGIRSAAEVEALVLAAKRVHFNTLFVQVRRRGDSLYTGGLEPALDDPNYDPAFDGLAAVVAAGHREGLKVHAWINAMPIWRDETPPRDPKHIFNRHGLGLSGPEAWLTRSREGAEKFSVGYFLDPGHPAVQNHLVAVYVDIARRYAVDGVHFDYIRYPETEDRMPRGSNVGYNAVSLARFQRATSRNDVPEPGDESWMNWRRQQVTELVRRVSIEVRAVNPRIQVSAASIAWGSPPRSLADFVNVAPMQRVFQNWQGWLAEGLLDMAVPMNYAREHDPRVREWFNGWTLWEKKNKAERTMVVGIGAYLNAKEAVLAQVGRVRAPAGRHHADGVSFFSYFRPAVSPAAEGQTASSAVEPEEPDRLQFLGQGAKDAPAAFAGPAAVPSMPWIERPTRGFIAGSAASAQGTAVEAATVRVRRTGWFRGTKRIKTDGNGWFGLMGLSPGKYVVRLDRPDGKEADSITVEVRPGVVTRVGALRVEGR